MRIPRDLARFRLSIGALTRNTDGNLSPIEIDGATTGIDIAAWKARTDDLIETLRAERAALEEKKRGASVDKVERMMLRGAEIDRTLAVLETTAGRLNDVTADVIPLSGNLQLELVRLAAGIDAKNRSAMGSKATMAFLQNVISGGRKIAAALER